MDLFIPGILALTSVSAYWVSVRWAGLSRRRLLAAVWGMFECIGTMLFFVVANLTVAGGVILGARVLLGRFMSLYLLDDVDWFVLSGLQGLTWWLWRQTS